MILIVDDTQENIFSLKTLLEIHKYKVDTALSGEEALRKILKNEYALIILDVQMPEMDGYEVAETISGYSKSKDIPIIFLSAVNIDKRFIKKGYESGGVDYITKPTDPDLLLLKVKTFYRLYVQAKELRDIKANLEQKVAQRTTELLQINRELETSNIELQQYASIASHDLQEPLRKITTFCHILADKVTDNSAEVKPIMSKIISSAERMRNLINDLLSYSKLSSGTHFSPVNLNDLVQETLADLELSIREKNAIVEVGPMPVIEGIPGQLRQVFQNIISNALKFSKSGEPPQIRISATYEEPAQPAGRRFVHITIADNGIGFDEAYVNKIFHLFQRLHRKVEYEGTGIGLAIVKKIVEKHHGHITAQSQEGQGASFIIGLPLTQPPVNQSVQTIASPV